MNPLSWMSLYTYMYLNPHALTPRPGAAIYEKYKYRFRAGDEPATRSGFALPVLRPIQKTDMTN